MIRSGSSPGGSGLRRSSRSWTVAEQHQRASETADQSLT
jgi:hypothetical protein